MKKKYSPWQQTFTNEIVELNQLDLNTINITDIAHALSMQCRFAGHIPKFYSVAEHSFMVSLVVPKYLALWGLMHDAAETYITDIPTYVKECVPEIKTLEDYILGRIAMRFNLITLTIPPLVKEADRRMLMTEKEQFYTEHVRDREISAGPYEHIRLECWEPKKAKSRFLLRFKELVE